MAIGQTSKAAFGRELAMLKPLGWMAGLAVIMMVIAVVYLSIQGEDKQELRAVLTPGEGETLELGRDYFVETFDGAPPEFEVEGFSVIKSVRVSTRTPEMRFSAPYLLTVPLTEAHLPAMNAAPAEALQMRKFDDDTAAWVQVRALPVTTTPPRFELRTAEPGLYGIGFAELEDAPFLATKVDRSQHAQVKRQLPQAAVTLLEKRAFVPVSRLVDGAFEPQIDYLLVLNAVPPLNLAGERSNFELKLTTPDGEQPAWVTPGLVARWYVTQDLGNMRVPEVDTVASDPGAFRFVLDQTLLDGPGEYHVVYELRDVAQHDELLASAWFPIKVIHHAPADGSKSDKPEDADAAADPSERSGDPAGE